MNEWDILAVVVGVVALLVAAALVANRTRVTVLEWQTGVLLHNGAYKRTLGPGIHRYFSPPHSWLLFDKRPQFVTIPGQEVLSRDALGLKITLVAEYQVEDPAKLIRNLPVTSQLDITNAIYPLIQLPIREAAATYTLDEILQNRDVLPDLVRAGCAERLAQAGIKLVKVAIRDIMIAKELRDAYAASAIAQKASLAELERARTEVAAMRALSNAARMTHGNPELMQLRALQAMQASAGRHTIVLDLAGKTPSAGLDSTLGDNDDTL